MEVEKLIVAERAGVAACAEGYDVSANPHEKDSPESFFWLSGWHREQTRKDIVKASMTMLAVARDIDVIQELVQSFHPEYLPVEEVVEKLSLLKKRLEDYVG